MGGERGIRRFDRKEADVRVQSHLAAHCPVENLYIDLSRRCRQPTALVFRHARLRILMRDRGRPGSLSSKNKLSTKDKGEGRGESEGGGESRNSPATR